jgi:hypothetical protein
MGRIIQIVFLIFMTIMALTVLLPLTVLGMIVSAGRAGATPPPPPTPGPCEMCDYFQSVWNSMPIEEKFASAVAFIPLQLMCLLKGCNFNLNR